MALFTDWNCKLLPMMGDAVRLPEEAVNALQILSERSGIRHFCMMPEYDCRMESVPMFLLRRSRAMQELKAILPSIFKVQTAACVVLCQGLSEIPVSMLQRLKIPQTNYFPLQLPLQPEPSWLAVELNRMLYHMPFRILFMSFDLYPMFYPADMLKRLLALPNAAYQFNYRAFQNPEIISMLRFLLRRNAPVLFGTSVNNENKACFYEFDTSIQLAKEQFKAFEIDDLFFRKRIYRKV